MKFRTLILTLVSMVFAVAAQAQSCPMCKESMTNAGEKLSDGFFLSIMSLFILPFVLIGGVTAMVVKSWWIKTHPGVQFTYARLFSEWKHRERT